MIMLFNKKVMERMQTEGEPNNDYKAILGFTAFILTVLVGFVITVKTGNMGMYSGLKIIGTSLAVHGVFWVGYAVVKKLKQ